jgi:hypothetical protein
VTLPRLLLLAVLPQGETARPLTAERQASQLKTRTSAALLGMGSLNAFASSAYAADDVHLFWDDEKLGKVRPTNPFPESYRPTWGEVFEAIGRQTQTSWSYSEKRGGWVFAKPAQAMPFTFELDAPVGMDIYHLGTYSFDLVYVGAVVGNMSLHTAIQENLRHDG